MQRHKRQSMWERRSGTLQDIGVESWQLSMHLPTSHHRISAPAIAQQQLGNLRTRSGGGRT
eukprot:2827992-Rhodomonas_salina.2